MEGKSAASGMGRLVAGLLRPYRGSVATILFVMTIVTSFFGQNFVAFIPYDSAAVFWGSIAFTVVSAAALALFFRRKGWL